MADGIESYDDAKNKARIAAGWKGGGMFQSPVLAPALNISGQGYPDGVDQKLQNPGVTQAPVQDPWMDRRK